MNRGTRPLQHGAAPLAVALGALLLAWPAVLNGYPLVFSDTGAFLIQSLEGWPVWDKPFVYGPLLHALHWRATLWLPLAGQVLLLSALLWRAQAMLAPATPLRHALLCAALAAATPAPWFAALLMPDIFAPMLVLAMAVLGFGQPRPAEAAALAAVAALATAVHLSHLPLAAALLAVIALLRGAWRMPAAALAAALLLLAATNLAAHGRAGLSPYGSVFALARLAADGPAARTLAAECPGRGWQLCAWAGRLPADSDAFLWDGDGPVWSMPGGPIALAPEASAILAATLRREPLGTAGALLANGMRQLLLVRVGDTLGPENLGPFVQQLERGFPPAEAAGFAASLQARGLLREAAAPFALPHAAALLLGLAGLLLGARRAPGLVACILVALLVNALVCGGLSGPHDRYQARLAWLLPCGALLLLRPRPKPAPAATPILPA